MDFPKNKLQFEIPTTGIPLSVYVDQQVPTYTGQRAEDESYMLCRHNGPLIVPPFITVQVTRPTENQAHYALFERIGRITAILYSQAKDQGHDLTLNLFVARYSLALRKLTENGWYACIAFACLLGEITHIPVGVKKLN